MTVRQRQDDRHQAIQSDILHMGSIANEMIRLAVESVVNGDLELAERVIGMDDEVDILEREAIHKTIRSMGLEAPVASDLMMLTATLTVIGEVEKVADDAVKLARRATKLIGFFPAEMKLGISQMGEASAKMFAASLRLYSDFSHDLAKEVIHGDKEIDTQYKAARDRVIELIQRNPENTAHLVRTIGAFQALEHVADRAVEIANRLVRQYS